MLKYGKLDILLPICTGSVQEHAADYVLAAGRAARDRTAEITAAGSAHATGTIVAAGKAHTRQDLWCPVACRTCTRLLGTYQSPGTCRAR